MTDKESDNKIVGFVAAEKKSNDILELRRLSVAGSYRGKGLG